VVTIYGIPNCDTCRKSRKWLETNSVEHRFHDLRADGLDKSVLARWAKHAGWQKLLNTRSTTWRGIPEADRQDLNEKRAIKLMLAQPTLIKRPVLDTGDEILLGFTNDTYADAISI
jgi:arsenate reductase